MNNTKELPSELKEIVLYDSVPIKIISSEDIRHVLSMKDAIKLMSIAFGSFSNDECEIPLRYVANLHGMDSTLIFKPAYMKKLSRAGIKILIQSNQRNRNKNFPTIIGIVILIDAYSGQIKALMDGSYLTALRTGAASGIATDYLARKNAETLAVFGCGAQGKTQLEAIASVRDIKKVYVYDIDPVKAEMFVKEMKGKFDFEIIPTDNLDYLNTVDIICTSTNSKKPLFSMDHIREGVHINAIGSYKPDMQEIDPGIIKNCKLYVDSFESCIKESGDIIIPLRDGIITKDNIIGEIGSVILGRIESRKTDNEITVFKSVGIAIQDLVVSNEIYNKLIN